MLDLQRAEHGLSQNDGKNQIDQACFYFEVPYVAHFSPVKQST